MPSADALSFKISREPDAVVVTVSGHLDVSRSTALGAVLGDLVDGQGNRSVRVDLRDLDSLERSAMGIFSVAARLAGHRAGDLTVTPPAPGSCPVHPPAAQEVGGGASGGHMVEFYDKDSLLAESVARHLEPALRSDAGMAIVVATKEHRDLFEAVLLAGGIEVGAARAAGRYVDLDAQDTLSRFMVGSAPDPAGFDSVIGGLVGRGLAAGGPLRIYGEMVALLWAAGNVPAAVSLEDLWNGLGTRMPFSLLCAYPVCAYDAPEMSGFFRMICERHLSRS